jgi:heme/copper-type cytochrome/quinol oxidase subunit 3
MSDVAVPPVSTHAASHVAHPSPDHHAPVTPGKVAMWLFLATEVMFFTGLIGSYIVLRAGSPSTYYSNLYAPTTNMKDVENTYGVLLHLARSNSSQVEEAIRAASPDLNAEEVHKLIEEAIGAASPDLNAEEVHKLVEEAHEGSMVNRLSKGKAQALHDQLAALGAKVKVEPLITHKWPKPYDELTNPLSINLTAFNTFVLICSSVTMVLALSAIQQGKRGRCTLFLGLTVIIGSIFLSIQISEYYELMVGRHYTPGISASGHFRPGVSLFASCFFTMTGFHGLHVTGGVITLILITIQSLRGVWTQTHYNSVEFAGLYWHFVDLVWIILFTIVYLI